MCYYSITSIENTLEYRIVLEDKTEKFCVGISFILSLCERGMDKDELEKKTFTIYKTKENSQEIQIGVKA